MRIFISYSRYDKGIVDVIIKWLRQSGYEVFDQDFDLKMGDNISSRIEKDASNADAWVAVVSSSSLKSKRVLQEFSLLAMTELSNEERKIVPIVIDDSPIPSYLSSYLRVDLSKDLMSGMHELLQALRAVERKELPDQGIGQRKKTEERDTQLSKLGTALRSGRLTLVCGAGVSVQAGIPTWNDLLLRLLESMIERLSKDQAHDLHSSMAADFAEQYGTSSALIIGKYLKNNFGEDFSENVRDVLYAKKPTTCDLIDAIIDLARPKRDSRPLDSIITFNFDALIEEGLDRANILNRPIFTEAILHETSEIPVYHVHGYLPREGTVPPGSDIVFSEDAYHSQFLDPFSWSNLIQLNKLTFNTCLFIGLSLTDPNLRRLLDVAWRKNPNKTISHYIVKKLPDRSGDPSLDKLARLLEEQDANALGMNIIWIENFDEIPELLKVIK